MNRLYFGDNLNVLRDMASESVDLIYLDPPFNSKRDYNILYKSPKGTDSGAQIMAFEDTWHWGEQAQREYTDLKRGSHTNLAEMMVSFRNFLGENDMMAYLVMMGSRMVELHRVLKSTGSLYLHCDPSANHYLKILLDSVFVTSGGKFLNEIIWRRTGSHNKVNRWGPIHDTLLFYSKSENYTWNHPKKPYMRGHVEEYFIKDEKGYRTNYYGNVLTGSGTRNGQSGMPWKGINPTTKGRHWAIPGALIEDLNQDLSHLTQHEKLDLLYELGHIRIIEGQAWPIYERYIKSSDGQAISDIWAFQPYTEGAVFGTQAGVDDDVRWLTPKDQERLGYPTQKPLGLLERIISASSNENDIILDPFCGCGTAVHAAQKLNRQWIGIDITHLAISLIERRLTEAFPEIPYEVEGTPKDLDGAIDLATRDKYQFQWWACALVDGQPFQGKKKGADGGIDGLIHFSDVSHGKSKDGKIIISVKSGDNVTLAMLKELVATVEGNQAEMGFFVTLTPPTRNMQVEARKWGYYKAGNGKEYPKIQILTIEGLLNGTERPEYFDLSGGQLNFKKAPKELKPAGSQTTLQLGVRLPEKPSRKQQTAAEKTERRTVSKGKPSSRKK